jgi:hypothetical protein
MYDSDDHEQGITMMQSRKKKGQGDGKNGKQGGRKPEIPPQRPAHERVIYCDPSLPEPDQCRQMCYQLARTLALDELAKGTAEYTEEDVDAIARETTRLVFEKKGAPEPKHHPLIGRDPKDAPWLN